MSETIVIPHIVKKEGSWIVTYPFRVTVYNPKYDLKEVLEMEAARDD
jgi:hypothetical protein